jgi:low affinity Fe/Cu permease
MPMRSWLGRVFDKFARASTNWTGSTTAFILATLVIVTWAVTGPIFNYSDTWQLVINTGTTIVTFLMVFLIQRAQNRDAAAVQLKLNELIAAVRGASNRMIGIEDLSDEDICRLRDDFARLATLARGDHSPGRHHSVEEMEGKEEAQKREPHEEHSKSTIKTDGHLS